MNNEENPAVLKPETALPEKNNRTSLSLSDQKKNLELESEKQKLKLKEKFANRIFYFLIAWCLLLFIFLFLQGICFLNLHFSILGVLAGGTTASMIFTMQIILKGLFGENKDSYKYKYKYKKQ